MCNNWLKFGKLWAYGKQLDADFIATGHYARIVRSATASPSCTAAVDPDKDQSYVLFGLRREPAAARCSSRSAAIARRRCGRLAREAGLARRRQAGQRRDLLRAGRRPRRVDPQPPARRCDTAGDIVDTAGNVLGDHDGIEQLHHRPAQGPGLRARRRAATCWRSCPRANEVVLGDREELLAPALRGVAASTG